MAKSSQPKDSPAMKVAWQLFDAGDKLSARRAAQKVIAAPSSPVDAEDAKDLIARTEPPAVFYKLAALCASLILAMIILALIRG